MKRIMIIGCGGAGKSTLAKKLHHILGHELIHLDAHFFTGAWVEPSPSHWQNTVAGLIKKECWIMDGNYGGTMDMRFARADTIIFLDTPTHARLWRVLLRTLRHLGMSRPEMPDQCRDRFRWQFFHYILMYNSTRRKGILSKLDNFRGQKSIHILRTNRQVADFLSFVLTPISDR